ncbi:FG-GAP-like repeat-containing protein [Stenotrophomonas sp. PS02289]|uniref:FG-GAP-like repeat-containing protein n=1 Tax=Stenotrophomonas sp. PS02289 TaxID=2991422 RepID=UPI00249ABE62|nr:FG-GAP-like repeat-containing protein [Stenotrophomonas sp. PS02289]
MRRYNRGIALALLGMTAPVLSAQEVNQEWVTVMEEHFNDPTLSYWTRWAGDVTDDSGAVAYTYRPENAFISQGDAVFRGDILDGTPYYQTGGLYYPRYFTYGRYSARVKMTNTPGVIPAFWLVSYAPACGEIDIFEATGLKQSNPRAINVQHFWFTNPADCSTHQTHSSLAAYGLIGTADYSLDYHIFSAEWTPNYVAYSVDGNEFYRSTLNVPNVPMLVHLNTNLAPPTSIPSYITNRMTADTVLPADFHVDWVKVEQLAPRACPARADYAGSLRRADGSCAPVRSVDYNGDGGGDLILYSPESGSAWVGTGQLTTDTAPVARSLTEAPGEAPWATGARLVSGDFDGDGFSDLLSYGGDGSVSIRYGRPDAELVEFVPGRTLWNTGSRLSAGDFNGDGYTDVLIVQATGTMEIRYGGKDRGLRFSPQSQRQAAIGSKAYVGDFNGDRMDDVLLYGPSGDIDVLYGQVGDGLRLATTAHDQYNPGLSFTIADFNGDGKSDALVYGTSGAVEIRYGQTNDGLRFAPTSQTSWNLGHTLLAGDYNGDGFDDVLIYASTGAVEIRYGQASDALRFSPQSVAAWSPGHKLSTNDFNGDGKTDVLVQSAGNDIEIRFGQTSDGLRFAPGTVTRWNPGLTIHTGQR